MENIVIYYGEWRVDEANLDRRLNDPWLIGKLKEVKYEYRVVCLI